MNTPLLEPLARQEWTSIHARHLLNRAGFGVDHQRADTLAKLGPDAAVRSLVDYEHERVTRPDFLVTTPEDMRRRDLALLDEDERRRRLQELRQQEREAIEKLKAWWLRTMLTTACPLREKMTLFWHGHFATSAQKVRSSAYTYHLNEVFRRHATGNFKALTIEVGQSPSMLRYLDTAQSTKKRPNENWARELMELFTMGQGHYTEQDIKESARAFTGWGIENGQFAYREGIHDFGLKQFMGRKGDFDGWDIIDIIFEQPATAEFISGKLWSFFAYERPEREIVVGLADILRRSGYELRPVLTTMFCSRAFYNAKAIGTQVKSPVQFLLQLASDLGMEAPPYFQMAKASAQLGQNLFFPPNVKGWDGNRAWINANTLLLRYNLPAAVAMARRGKDLRMLSEQEKLDAPRKPAAETEAMVQTAAEEAVWDPLALFAHLQFNTPESCIRALERHFLSVPLSSEQRRLLVQAFASGQADAPLELDGLNPSGVRAALHLLLSSAEYQLC